MMFELKELELDDDSSPFSDWFSTLTPEVAAKIITAQARMSLGNLSNVEWFRGIGEYKIDFGAGWRIYLAKDGLQLIILIGGGSKKTQQRDIDRALDLWADYKRRKAALAAAKPPKTKKH